MSPKRLFLILLLISAATVGFVLLSKDRLKIKQDMKTRRREYMQQLIDSVRTARDLYKDSLRRVEYGLPPLPTDAPKNDAPKNNENKNNEK